MPLLVTVTFSFSIDCPDLIQFGYNLGIQTARPAIWTSLQSDCCLASGVTCVSQRVTQITWNSMGLSGFVNGSAVPQGVFDLKASFNSLSGTLPTSLPPGLQTLHLEVNRLTGIIPPLPSSLQDLGLYANKLLGPIPAAFPNSLTIIGLDNNLLNGTIPSTLPSGLRTLWLYNNMLTGDLPTFPSSLQRLSLGFSGSSKKQTYWYFKIACTNTTLD